MLIHACATMVKSFFEAGFIDPQDDNQKSRWAFFWAAGLPLILFPVFTFALTMIWFALGGALSMIPAWLILCLSAIGALALPHGFIVSDWPRAAVSSLAAGVVAVLIASVIHDTSIDGQHYHFQATYALAQGWNPLRGVSEAVVIADPMTPWALHYPRGGWVVSANLLAAGLPLSMVKAMNFLVLLGTAALLAGTLLRFGFSYLFAGIMTAAAIFNPVILAQLFTAMNDGLYGLCILLFLASMAIWIGKGERLALVAAGAAIILAVNLKFSAIAIFFILSAFSCFAALAFRGHRKALQTATALLGSAVVGIFVLGWSPYVQNYVGFGHPFHPVMGADAIDIMSGDTPELQNTPPVLEPLSPGERFLFSLFSETHSGFGTEPRLKIPFATSVAEIRASGDIDVRVAGFGVFFSGIFLLALAGTVLMAASARLRNPVTLGLFFVAGASLVSVLLMPHNWWARYVPQFWLVPLCIAAAALTVQRLPVQIVGALIVTLSLLSAGLSGASMAWLAMKRSAEASAQLRTLQQTDIAYCVYPQMAHSRIYLMRETGLNVRYVDAAAIGCDQPEPIAGYGPDVTGGLICPCPEN